VLRAALDRHGVSAGIMASEDNDEGNTTAAISAYDPATLGNVSGITTHTYFANAPRQLRTLAEKTGKPLWVSEYGDGDYSGLRLARRIRDDIAGLHAREWTYWQFADYSGWGLISNSIGGDDEQYRITKKFYIFAQFSRFIRPGCEIVDVNNGDSLAAFDAGRKQIAIVTVNDRPDACTEIFKISGVKTTTGTATVYRTSADEDLAPQPPISMLDNKLTVTLPARSVTTLVISNLTISN